MLSFAAIITPFSLTLVFYYDLVKNNIDMFTFYQSAPFQVNGCATSCVTGMAHILVQVTIYRTLRIGRDGHLDQSEAYDVS